jgi:hypothetical protein
VDGLVSTNRLTTKQSTQRLEKWLIDVHSSLFDASGRRMNTLQVEEVGHTEVAQGSGRREDLGKTKAKMEECWKHDKEQDR